MSVSLTGSDVAQINDRVLNNLADGDSFNITFPNDLAVAKAAKNGNTLFAQNETGRMGEISIRLLLGSPDDKYMNSLRQQQISSFSNFILMTGNFSKRVGDGLGVISTKVYQCTGGIFKKNVEAKTNAEGDIEQSVAVYSLQFANVQVSVQ